MKFVDHFFKQIQFMVGTMNCIWYSVYYCNATYNHLDFEVKLNAILITIKIIEINY